MEIEHYLKQLKRIEPRAEYVLYSRAKIVTTPRNLPRVGWRQVVFGMAQSGSAMALLGVFFILLAGGFSLMKIVGWDRQSITVEAQAIDMQIQLADLKYTDFVSTAGNTPLKTNPAHPGSSVIQGVGQGNGTNNTSSKTDTAVVLGKGDATTTPTSTAVVGVDAALDALSQ